MTDISDDIPQIILTSDHAGYEQKENILNYLKTNYPHMNIIDLNPELLEGDDYPDAVFSAKEQYDKLKNKKDVKIIAICGTGNGMCIALNRYIEFRAINAYSSKHVILGRQHNDANCLCLGGPIIMEKKAIDLVKLFLFTKFSYVNRHVKRIEKLNNKERFCN